MASRIPVPPPPATRAYVRPRTYPDRLLLQALMIMSVRHVHTLYALLCVLAQPTAEMHTWRCLLTVDGRGTLSRPPHLGAAAPGHTAHAARADRLSWPTAGIVEPAMGQVWARCRHRQHHLAGAGQRLAQKGPRRRDRATHLNQSRSALNPVGLARLGLRLETTPGDHRRRGLDPRSEIWQLKVKSR
jgi:hypothetical protein